MCALDEQQEQQEQRTTSIKSEKPYNNNTLKMFLIATVYVLSGVCQPLEVQWATDSGIADMSCGVLMLFYQLGPALLILSYICNCNSNRRSISSNNQDGEGNINSRKIISPKTRKTTTRRRILPQWIITYAKICLLALVDLTAGQIFTTGATMAGATIFAIIYSSVTIWCAVLSRIILGRRMSYFQWFSVFVVFGGLTVTGFSSVSVGAHVSKGALMIAIGTALHALSYVVSELILNHKKESHNNHHHTSTNSKRNNNKHNNSKNHHQNIENNNHPSPQEGEEEEEIEMSSRLFCTVFSCMSFAVYFVWQFVYTRYHYQEKLIEPMERAHTTPFKAIIILLAVMITSLIHGIAFFDTIQNFPGGATSAGIMKGLQAVLVFVATPWFFCNAATAATTTTPVVHTTELCFSMDKMISLVIVVVGVLLFGKATELVIALEEEEKQSYNNEKINENREQNNIDDDDDKNRIEIIEKDHGESTPLIV